MLHLKTDKNQSFVRAKGPPHIAEHKRSRFLFSPSTSKTLEPTTAIWHL